MTEAKIIDLKIIMNDGTVIDYKLQDNGNFVSSSYESPRTHILKMLKNGFDYIGENNKRYFVPFHQIKYIETQEDI